jgi:hypothetical protein
MNKGKVILMLHPRWLLPAVIVLPGLGAWLSQSPIVGVVLLAVFIGGFIFYGKYYKNNK